MQQQHAQEEAKIKSLRQQPVGVQVRELEGDPVRDVLIQDAHQYDRQAGVDLHHEHAKAAATTTTVQCQTFNRSSREDAGATSTVIKGPRTKLYVWAASSTVNF
jgi:hypothetical protein